MADDDGNEGNTTPPTDPPPPDTGGTDDVDKWKSLSRKHEKDFKAANRKVTELESELEKVQASVDASEADKARASSDVALARLNAQLARAGVPEETVNGLLEVLDPGRLLNKDGTPSDDQIKKVAAAIAASAPRKSEVPPDPDQGKGDKGEGKPTINDLFRAAARR